MSSRVHTVAGILALTLITTFFISSLVVEILGDNASVATVKQWIFYGVCVLVPTMAATGASGRVAAGRRNGPLIRAKQRRLIVIASIGLLVLVPCAVILWRLAATGTFGSTFVVLQLVEFAGGAVNIALMSMNVRAGLLLTGRIRRSPRQGDRQRHRTDVS